MAIVNTMNLFILGLAVDSKIRQIPEKYNKIREALLKTKTLVCSVCSLPGHSKAACPELDFLAFLKR
jgi:hypothetical protein